MKIRKIEVGQFKKKIIAGNAESCDGCDGHCEWRKPTAATAAAATTAAATAAD